MNRQRAAKVITFTVLALLMGLLLYRQRGGFTGPSPASTPQVSARKSPEDAVYAMQEAAKGGDVQRYLECFGGEMRLRLDAALQETGSERFRAQLVESDSALKGIAISGVDLAVEGEATLNAEFVYADRNEIQSLSLRNEQGQWKIVRMETAEARKSPVPYGTPVAPMQPEGGAAKAR